MHQVGIAEDHKYSRTPSTRQRKPWNCLPASHLVSGGLMGPIHPTASLAVPLSGWKKWRRLWRNGVKGKGKRNRAGISSRDHAKLSDLRVSHSRCLGLRRDRALSSGQPPQRAISGSSVDCRDTQLLGVRPVQSRPPSSARFRLLRCPAVPPSRGPPR